MWGTYRFRGHRVQVIQQWRDPFGQRMVRIAVMDTAPDAPLEDGMTEAAFLGEAVPEAAGG